MIEQKVKSLRAWLQWDDIQWDNATNATLNMSYSYDYHFDSEEACLFDVMKPLFDTFLGPRFRA